MQCFVQFMHNGREAIPDGKTSIDWNKGTHQRKFLKCDGIRLDENWSELHEDIMFWGEWEPESLVIKRLKPPLKEGPRYIYSPFYVRPKSYEGLQNTDPFVFGSEFRYSLCQQPSHPSLRNLERGSVILFGSCLGKKFALDTVFVASGDYVDYSPRNYDALFRHVDETYRIVTMNPILAQMGNANGKACAGKTTLETLRSHRGATFDKPVDDMFSFFPCQAYTEDALGFARPTIRMPPISDKLIRGVKITQCNSLDDASDCWEEVVRQVLKTCSLGIFAEMPPEISTQPLQPKLKKLLQQSLQTQQQLQHSPSARARAPA